MKKILTIIAAIIAAGAILAFSLYGITLWTSSGDSLTREERIVAESLSIEAVRVELSDDMFSGFIALKNVSYESIYDYVEFSADVSYKDYDGIFMYASQPVCDDSSPFAAQEIRPFFIMPAVNAQASATIKDNEWDLGYRLIISYRVNGGEWIKVKEYEFPAAEKYYGSCRSIIKIGDRLSF